MKQRTPEQGGALSRLAEWPGVKGFLHYYPFTFSGTLLLAAALYLMGVAYGTGNQYAFLFSLFSLALLLILAVDSRLQAFRLSGLQLTWNSNQPLQARREGVYQTLHAGDARIHYFFRLHFVLRGVLRAGRDTPLYIRTEGSSSGGGEIRVPLYFPLSGEFEAEGTLLLRDVFGFVSTRVGGEENRRTMSVRPAIFEGKGSDRWKQMFSFESSKRQQLSEEEKYYMRQYIPGDRMKDINWKASFRFHELITRISPHSQEQSTLIHIEFRNYRAGKREGRRSLVHLEYLKSWLLTALAELLRSRPGYRFRIVTSEGPTLVESEQDLERFASTLGRLGYAPFGGSEEYDPSLREMILFTTPYDTALPVHLQSRGGVRYHIFRTREGRGKEIRSIALLSSRHPESRPGLWIFRRDPVPDQKLPSSGTEEGLRVDEPLHIRYI